MDYLEFALDRVPLKAATVSLDESAAKALEKLTGKPSRPKGSGIAIGAQAKRKAGLQPRTLSLDSGQDDAVLIVSGTKGNPSRFGPGEVSIFEIRLNHY